VRCRLVRIAEWPVRTYVRRLYKIARALRKDQQGDAIERDDD
jgi:hypothetical protein